MARQIPDHDPETTIADADEFLMRSAAAGADMRVPGTSFVRSSDLAANGGTVPEADGTLQPGTLNQTILQENGERLTVRADNLKALVDTTALQVDGLQVQVRALFSNGLDGGGLYAFDGTKDKSTADGIRVIDPDNVGTLSATAFGTYFTQQGTGSGGGVFVKQIKTTSLLGPETGDHTALPDIEQSPRVQAMFDAERIRRNAGVPPGIRLGPKKGAAPGLSDAGALVVQPRIDITAEAVVSGLAASGTGSFDDPYVLQNLDISQDSGTDNFGIRWTDSAADYHIKLVNCRIRGWGVDLVQVSGPSGVTLEALNCEFDSDHNPDENSRCVFNSNLVGPGNRVIFRECLFRTDPNTRVATTGMGVNCTNEHYDCKFVGLIQVTGHNGLVGSSLDLGDARLVVRRCDFTEATPGGNNADAFIQLGAPGLTFEIERCDFPTSYSQTGVRSSTSSGTRVPVRKSPTGTIRFCNFRESSGNAVNISFGDGILIENCTSLNVTNGTRRNFQVGSNGLTDPDAVPRNVTIRRCYGHRNTGGVFSEVFLGEETENLRFLECWAEHSDTADDDAFEIYNPHGWSECGHCVGDNIQGEIVDFFQREDSEGENEFGYIHHIYGSSNEEVVQMTNIQSATVGPLYAETTHNQVILLDNRWTGLPLNNVHIIGPMPLPESSPNGTTIQINDPHGTIGSNITSAWIENGTLENDGLTAEEKANLKVR